MKKIFYVFLAAMIFLVSGCQNDSYYKTLYEKTIKDFGSFNKDKIYKVLILNSYSIEHVFTVNEVRGILDSLRSNPTINLEISYLYMDTKTNFESTYLQELHNLLMAKYADTVFDFIVVTDNEALEFAKLHKDGFFKSQNLIFCGISNFSPSLIEGLENISGVIEANNLERTLDIIPKIRPMTENIFVVTDQTITGSMYRKLLEDYISKQENGPKIMLLDMGELKMAELLARICLIPNNDSLIILQNFVDKDGVIYSVNQAMKLFLECSRVPIFVSSETRLGMGGVGGNVASGFKQGQIAGQIGMRLLNGESLKNIPVVTEDTNIFSFDHNVLKKWNIDEKLLPKDSVITNKITINSKDFLIFIIAAFAVFLAIYSIIMTLKLRKFRRKSN